METKKILIISRTFYPRNSPRSFRTTELAKELARQGHDVTVLIPKISEHTAFEKEHNLTIEDLGHPRWKDFQLTGKGIGLLFKRGLRRGLNFALEYPDSEYYFKVKRALKKKRKAKEHYDLLISIAVPYPIHWGVASVWRKKNNIATIWIADCGDPYFFQENDTFKKLFYFKWIEQWFMRKADFISVPTCTSYKGYFPEFHSKLKIIPQGFRFEDITNYNVMDDGIVRFGYGGSFALNRRDPKELLEYLTKLDNSFKFEFHIYTNNKNFVANYSEKDNRIKLHSPIQRKQLLEKFSTFNFVVNMANFGTAQTPSKLIDYAIIDKPILQIETGNLKTKTVLEFLEGNYNNSIKVQDLEEYRIENVAQKFVKLASNA